ncbi:MAG: hypothetical protein HRT47_01425 [Candidatus Caenarcaniphilales bacterium]|nr:hypothetical protein [Candidatus Caenarcaniphilales bacterium]
MVDKSSVSIPSTSALNKFTNGKGNTIDANLLNPNFSSLLANIITIAGVIKEQMPELKVESIYTALQEFQAGIKADSIKESTTGADILLSTDGSGKVRYDDGNSADTEIATHSYVTLNAGNIPSGGANDEFFRGDAAWALPAIPVTPISTSTTTDIPLEEGRIYRVNTSGGSITLHLPTSFTKPIAFLVEDGSSWADNNFTINGNGTDIVVQNSDLTKLDPSATVSVVVDKSFMIYPGSTNRVLKGI